MAVDVFIVHASPDKERATELRAALERTHVTSFLDAFDIAVGEPWDERLKRELRDSLLQVVLIGTKDRHYQLTEIAAAIKTMLLLGADDRIVPILLSERAELPYGLERIETLRWNGPEATAAEIAGKVASLRGARIDGGKLVSTAKRIRVGVAGFWHDMPEQLEALRTRIGQRAAILDGEVRRIDLEQQDSADMDLMVVLLGSRHHQKRERVERLIDQANETQSNPVRPMSVLVAALEIIPRKIPAEFRTEANELIGLLERMADRVFDESTAAIDAVDKAVSSLYATRYPNKPGHSVTLEAWEEQYLHDKVPLWRQGDPSALRTVGGRRAQRVQWYVHLAAAEPWVFAKGELRLRLATNVLEQGRGALGVQWLLLPPGQQWPPARLEASRRAPAEWSGEGVPLAPAWLDSVLSHRALPRIVVVGAAGTGKSVLLQHLAWALSSNEPAGIDADAVHHLDRAGVQGRSPIPPIPILHSATTVVAHLRNRGSTRPIREALVELLRSSDTFGEAADAASLRAGIESGRYLFLIDSLDEIPSRQDREALVSALGALDGSAPRVILTTRPTAHTDVDLPEGFDRVDIAHLDEETQERIVRKWVATWAPGLDLDGARAAVSRVRTDFPTQAGARSPVENALLLSCVLQVYATYRRLPDDIAKLYSEMVRVLCEAKIRAADEDQRDSVVEKYREALRELFLATQEQGGTRLAVADACELIAQKKLVPRDRAENWLQKLANHTGLIRFEGTGDEAVIRPWHRSYQEYLATEAIALRYANKPDDCVAYLRAIRETRGPRLTDAGWQGALRFLAGAALHQNRPGGVVLIEALVRAAEEGGPQQGPLWGLAATAAAEYDRAYLATESVRTELPGKLVASYDRNGHDWPLSSRFGALVALGRLGDPRLPDPRTIAECTLETGWAYVPAGAYFTGADGNLPPNYLPRKQHVIDGFWIRRWPVTVAEWFARSEATDRPQGIPDLRVGVMYPNSPMINVNWFIARAFCRWAQEHWKLPADGILDLPTSTEWEIAARRNTDRRYPWGDDEPGRGDLAAANYGGTNIGSPVPVGMFPRGHTPEGLWDMGGNVFEWCSSFFARGKDIDYPIDFPDPEDPPGEAVYRGGSSARGADTMGVSRRGDWYPKQQSDQVGFRIVCRARPAQSKTG